MKLGDKEFFRKCYLKINCPINLNKFITISLSYKMEEKITLFLCKIISSDRLSLLLVKN